MQANVSVCHREAEAWCGRRCSAFTPYKQGVSTISQSPGLIEKKWLIWLACQTGLSLSRGFEEGRRGGKTLCILIDPTNSTLSSFIQQKQKQQQQQQAPKTSAAAKWIKDDFSPLPCFFHSPSFSSLASLSFDTSFFFSSGMKLCSAF